MFEHSVSGDVAQPVSTQAASSGVGAIVLAGAYPRTNSAIDRLSPRPLLPVAQQPLITYGLRWLSRAGVSDTTICINNATRGVRQAVESANLGISMSYLEDWTPRGTAGCVRDAALLTDNQTFVVIDGTSVPTVGLQDVLQAHSRSRAALTIVVGQSCEAGEERLLPTGQYIFDRRVVAYIQEEGFHDIKERLLPRLHQAGERVSMFSASVVAPRIVDCESYLALNLWILEQGSNWGELPDDFQVSGEALVHTSASVDPTARLLGPVVLGRAASVLPGATIVGPCSIGRDSVVGREAVVSRSVIWSGCRIGDGAFVDRCTLADGAFARVRSTLYSAVKSPSRRDDGDRHAVRRETRRSMWSPLAGLLRQPTIDAR
jgi:NDP-sugar pyrophosphorylase family protein